MGLLHAQRFEVCRDCFRCMVDKTRGSKAKPKYRRRKNGRQLPFPHKRIIETAAVNLKPLALSLSKGEQAYGLRQAQPERLFQEQRGRLNSPANDLQCLAFHVLCLAYRVLR